MIERCSAVLRSVCFGRWSTVEGQTGLDSALG